MRVEEPLSELGYTVAPMEKGAELVVGRALVVVVDDRVRHESALPSSGATAG